MATEMYHNNAQNNLYSDIVAKSPRVTPRKAFLNLDDHPFSKYSSLESKNNRSYSNSLRMGTPAMIIHDAKPQQEPLQVSSIAERLADLRPASVEACIYKVPKQLREKNEKAYTPLVVSIGPYTHGMQGLEFMENVKLRHLQTFLKWTEMNIKDLITFIAKREAEVRAYYATELNVESEKFVDIIVVDAAFILVTLLDRHFGSHHDTVFELEQGQWSRNNLFHDLALLENQLPLFILSDLLEVARLSKKLPRSLDNSISIVDLVIDFFEFRVINEADRNLDDIDPSQLQHFVDVFRICHRPSTPRPVSFSRTARFRPLNLTELHKAGVKFRASSSSKWTDIQFTDGVLEMPIMDMHDDTESILRNVLAFEQFHGHHLESMYITDYVAAMSKLVKTADDVELLDRNGILVNDSGHYEEVSNLFSKLNKEAYRYPSTFYYARIFEDLDSHCKSSWNKWSSTLTQGALKNPWMIISMATALILLIITMKQSSC